MARRKALGSASDSKFTEENLKALSRDMKSGRIMLDRMTLSDDIVTGLRAMVLKSGVVSFHVSYHLGGRRPFMVIGELTDDKKNLDRLTLEEARDVARTVKHLAETTGIDPQEGLHRRLVRELKEKGKNWRP